MLDSRALRNSLGRFATGVSVVTTTDPERGPMAMTVNSFAAVSLEPPLVLWSIQNTSECYDAFTQCDRYGISVLSQHQAHLSSRYARSHEHHIDDGDCVADEVGVLLVSGAIATFSCRTVAIHEGGDHKIIVGEVEAFSEKDGEPLVFFGGAYRQLA